MFKDWYREHIYKPSHTGIVLQHITITYCQAEHGLTFTALVIATLHNFSKAASLLLELTISEASRPERC
jgi:hypothetical protein